MKQQLYINGVAVDMPAETIKIKVASNIMTDVGKTMTAHSYNIALPRTITNDKVFSLAYVAGAATGGKSTHTYLKASLFIDDVPLFSDGKAVLTQIDSKGYNVTLLWGLVDVFDEIKNEGLKLCDLPLSVHWDEDTMATWIELSQYNDPIGGVPWSYETGMDSDIYNTLDDKSKRIASSKPWRMPVIPANDIMNKIAEVYGITWNYSARMSTALAKLYHPLTSLKAKCDDELITCQWVSADYDVNNAYHDRGITWSPYRTSNNRTILDDMMYVYGHMGASDASLVGKDVVFVTFGDNKIAFDSFHVYGSANHAFCLTFHEGWASACQGGTPVLFDATSKEWKVDATDNGNGTWTIDVTFTKVSHAGFLPRLRLVGGWWLNGTRPVHDVKCDMTITESNDVLVGQNWCYERNYPTLTIMEYISEILAHCGAFIVGSIIKPNALRLVTIDEVITASPILCDTQGVNNIVMSLDGLAQKNNYTHKVNDDDGLDYDASGVIYTSDETLAVEAVGYDSKFKVPRNNMVKLWEVSVNTDSDPTDYSAKWVKAGDYIGGMRDETTRKVFANTGQDFASLISTLYINYESVVTRPKVIEADIHFLLFDLMKINFEKPLYINQLGRSYVIVSIENTQAYTYKLKLIQI